MSLIKSNSKFLEQVHKMRKINIKGRTGNIIWIHPEKRFVVVEFTFNTCMGTKKYKEAQKIINGKLSV